MPMSASRLIDLTHALRPSTPAYPGDPPFTCTPHLTASKDGCNVAHLTMSSHSGTHVDAPYHFFDDGKKLDELPLEWLIDRPVKVVDLRRKEPKAVVDAEDLAPALDSIAREGVDVLLLCTGWDQYWTEPKYFSHPFLSRAAAQAIVDSGVRVVGMDCLSPDETRTDGTIPSYAAHEVILGGKKGMIAENLTGLYELLDLPERCKVEVSLVPMHVGGGDGAPIRAFAKVYE